MANMNKTEERDCHPSGRLAQADRPSRRQDRQLHRIPATAYSKSVVLGSRTDVCKLIGLLGQVAIYERRPREGITVHRVQ